MIKPPHILIVAGDASGDQHAAALAQALKQRLPQMKISALGGTHLRQAADHFAYPLVGVGGFGFWEPLFKLTELWKAWQGVKTVVQEERPDVVIPVDYYGFNIHVARLAHAAGIPVVYYVSPQVWASRSYRLRKIGEAVDKILVIFPFEEALYRKAGIPVQFVGHPLLDEVPAPSEPSLRPVIGLLPGSRWSVVQRHLPIVIQTAERLRQKFPNAEFILFRPSELAAERYQPFLSKAPWLRLACDNGYEERKRLSLAISVSGTAALENTLLGIPMIVMYQLSALTYQIAKRVIRVPFVAIPNILAGRAIVPEMLQADATPERLALAAQALLENPARYKQMRQDLLSLRTQLGEKGSVLRAADEIIKIIEARPERAASPRVAMNQAS